ncbi:hypothetical protein RSAG8_00483, partial [Rhizoctonia solani AG-8 WAC10335]
MCKLPLVLPSEPTWHSVTVSNPAPLHVLSINS